MFVTLFRHGEKSLAFKSDPELSNRGKNQALNLNSWAQEHRNFFPDRVYSSPKLRARQTMENFCQKNQIPLIVHQSLDEQKSSESNLEFRQRIQSFLAHLSSQNISTFICTHFDWILEFMGLPEIESCKTNDGPQAGTFYVYEVTENFWKLLQEGILDDH